MNTNNNSQLITRHSSLVTAFWQDIRYGFRQLTKKPGFTVIAVLTLAIGIGATTSIFSVLKSLVLFPSPYPDSERIVYLWSNEGQPFSLPDFLDIRDQNKSFEEIGVYSHDRFNLGGDSPESICGVYCSSGVLRTMGIKPALGRWLEPSDEKPGASSVIIISDSFWKRNFASDPAILGKAIQVNGTPMIVVGVMPRQFEFFSPWGGGSDLWIPLDLTHERARGNHWLLCTGRIKPGIPLQNAEAEIKTIGKQLAKAYPTSNLHIPFVLQTILKEMTKENASKLWILTGAVFMVLLVSCANVASMLLAKSMHRQSEFGIRIALGASRKRILRLLLSECVLLGLLGSGLGVLFALWGVEAIQNIIPATLERRNAIQIDAPVLWFSVFLTFITVLLFGLPPAFTAARTSIMETLKQEGKSQSGSRIRNRFLKGLVVAQVALALMLANGAVLLSVSYLNVLKTNKALDTEFVLSSEIVLDKAHYKTEVERNRFWGQLVEHVKTLPGVKAAAVTNKLPLEGGSSSGYLVDDQTYEPGADRPWVEGSYISPDYFTAMNIPLLRGRFLNEEDGKGESIGVIINRSFVEKYWKNEEPLGRRIRPDGEKAWFTAKVVGVVEDVRQWGPERPAIPEIYFLYSRDAANNAKLIVRTKTESVGFTPLLRRELTALDNTLPLANIRTMKEVVGNSMHARRFLTQLINFFMAIALILCAVGIYGVLSHQLVQRTREIGLRMALGASPKQITMFVFHQAGTWVFLGLGIGILCTWALTFILRSIVFGISPLNPLSLALGLGLAFGAAGLACLVPAWRAVKVDPMTALRCE